MLDDELVIETPERVELHYVLANVGNRFLAAAIDHLIQVGLAFLVLVIAGAFRSGGVFSSMGVWAAALAVLAVFAIYWGYFVVFETLWSGQTPGKRIMRLRVVREDGRPVRFFEVFVRNLLRLALDFQPFPTYAIGVISIIFSARSKRVGGAYSYALPGQKAARNRLALPFEKRVFFAGEATHGSDFSTAHGAHDSGTRAATEVIAALKN